MKVLITGVAGFIGSRLAEMLCAQGDTVVGIDNMNSYYDPRLKEARLRRLGFILPEGLDSRCERICAGTLKGECVESLDIPDGTRLQSQSVPNLTFVKADICDAEAMERLFAEEKFDAVMNLAAQAGVRYSIENPMAYIESNIVGFVNLLECLFLFRLWRKHKDTLCRRGPRGCTRLHICRDQEKQRTDGECI